jgi:hypothetical protein
MSLLLTTIHGQTSVKKMPALTEAWDQQDDWTGIASPAERRIRQNRLNQRAYRRFGLRRRCHVMLDRLIRSRQTEALEAAGHGQ